MRAHKTRLASAVAAGGALLVLAACGSSSGGSAAGSSGHASGTPSGTAGANSGGSTSTNPAVQAAKHAVADLSAVQTPIEVPALTKPAPKHVRLSVLTCVVPVCKTGTDAAITAAKKLGWTVTEVQTQITPADYSSGWTTVMQQKPDAILFVPTFPSEVAAQQIAEAKRLKIALIAVSYNAPTLQASGADYAVTGAPELAKSGELMGDVIVADAGGPTDVLFVWDPTLSNTLTPVKNALTDVATKAGARVQVLKVSLSGIGQTIPGEVVNYLQRHPEIKYIVMSLADFDSGVPQALSAVGLNGKVKIVSRAPQPGDLAQVKSGAQFATVAEEVSASGYRAVDDVIRLLSGGAPVERDPVGWHQILFKDNITQTQTTPVTPGVPDVFYKAWQVG